MSIRLTVRDFKGPLAGLGGGAEGYGPGDGGSVRDIFRNTSFD